MNELAAVAVRISWGLALLALIIAAVTGGAGASYKQINISHASGGLGCLLGVLGLAFSAGYAMGIGGWCVVAMGLLILGIVITLSRVDWKKLDEEEQARAAAEAARQAQIDALYTVDGEEDSE